MFSCTRCIEKLTRCPFCHQRLTEAYEVYVHFDGELSSSENETYEPFKIIEGDTSSEGTADGESESEPAPRWERLVDDQ